MFFQLKFKFSKKIQTVYDFIKYFFLTGLLCFSSKSVYPEYIKVAMFTFLTKKLRVYLNAERFARLLMLQNFHISMF